MASITQRQAWMKTVAKAELKQLEALVSKLDTLPSYSFLRSPEIGLTMVQGSTGGTGSPFNLGDMTITRCVVKLESPTKSESIVGFGFVGGRSHRHAELAAFCDALLQSPEWHDQIQAEVIQPLQTASLQRQELRKRQTAATKVNFLTMVRGE
ncbi:phosphonate C-P lyase system protein PhnG [Nodularia spumigena CS-584]|nr:phosphonate C-P lyase system protein PhnG [Nodularia spumigena]AHJ27106.1 PhnG protein [Nodularia spumigena CCY9414]EAW47325.1 phosphonate metabolism protein [Nodularia spumigena CCY9414]MDB9382975.1 phosphonate C-P lyase system protein PhnG [Nodularia spumigena CS-584]MEA5523695.1 phosphonate C-P lyase system protein PhnG [Nodularia spumigena UHCC 0143]MEA5555600.1 phosphonate C-P lyase system protein PhnG [Nodularia spumigena CH309]